MKVWFFAGLSACKRLLAHPSRVWIFLAVVLLGVFFVAHGSPALAKAADETKTLGPIDFTFLWLASVAIHIAQIIGQLVLAAISVIVTILQYNNFVDSPVIGMGWSVVRDTVNLGFVIILVVIALGTLLGIDKFKWQQQVPKLLGFAILVNFSRTICGIAIDLSQVVTLAFVTSIRDIAGGNFIEMFGLREIMQFDQNVLKKQIEDSASPGITPFDNFAASFVAVFMMAAVLVILGYLIAIFAFRIVLLWILVVTAPLAWLFHGGALGGGVGSIFGGVDSNDWFNQFKCALLIGPVLTFFLWLSLAVAGTGSLAASEGFFVANESTNVSGNLNAIMDTSRLVSFVLSFAILLAGIDQTTKLCGGSKLGGMLKDAQGWTHRIAKMPAGLGVAAGGYVASKTYRGGAAATSWLGRNTVGRAATAAKGAVAGGAEKYGTTRLPFAGAAAAAATRAKAGRMAEVETSAEGKREFTSKERADFLNRGMPTGVAGKNRYMREMRKAMQDGDTLKALGPEGLQKLMKQKYGLGDATVQQEFESVFGKDDKALKEMKTKMPSMFGEGAIKDIKEADEVVKLEGSEFENQAVRDQVAKLMSGKFEKRKKIDPATGKVMKNDEGKDVEEEFELTVEEAITKGKLGGNRTREAWKKGAEKIAEKSTADALLAQKAKDVELGALREDNFTPEVGARLLSQRDRAAARELGRQQRLKGKLEGEDLSKLKAAGLGLKTKKERDTFQANLAATLSTAGIAGAVGKAYNIKEDGAFEGATEDQRTENEGSFSDALKANPDLYRDLDYSSADRRDTRVAAASISKEAKDLLMEDYTSAMQSGDEQEVAKTVGRMKTLVEAADAEYKSLRDEAAKFDGSTNPANKRTADTLKKKADDINNRINTLKIAYESNQTRDAYQRTQREMTAAAAPRTPAAPSAPAASRVRVNAGQSPEAQQKLADVLQRKVDQMKRTRDQIADRAAKASLSTERVELERELQKLSEQIDRQQKTLDAQRSKPPSPPPTV